MKEICCPNVYLKKALSLFLVYLGFGFLPRLLREGGHLLDDVLHGIAQPLIKGDVAGLLDIHVVKLPLAGGNTIGIVLEHGLGGWSQAKAARGNDSQLDHFVKLDVANSSVPLWVQWDSNLEHIAWQRNM